MPGEGIEAERKIPSSSQARPFSPRWTGWGAINNGDGPTDSPLIL